MHTLISSDWMFELFLTGACAPLSFNPAEGFVTFAFESGLLVSCQPQSLGGHPAFPEPTPAPRMDPRTGRSSGCGG